MTTAPSVAERIERRWATLSVVIIVVLVAAWRRSPASTRRRCRRPGSRRPIPRTLHLAGEFIESNLGSAIEPDGSVTVRAIGQQYSFTPPCILVPTRTPITFRATSADVVHGFLIEGTNVNTMLVPGYVSEQLMRFRQDRRPSHAVPGVLRLRARRHVGQGQGDRQGGVRVAGGRTAEAELCWRIGNGSSSRISGWPSPAFGARAAARRLADVRPQPAPRLDQQSGMVLPLAHRARHGDGLRVSDAGRDGLRLRDHRVRAEAAARRRALGLGRVLRWSSSARSWRWSRSRSAAPRCSTPSIRR